MEKRIEAELPNQKFTVDDAKRMLEKLSETFGNKSVGDMWSMGFLTTMSVTDILDLLNSQKAENEKLNVELAGMRGACESYKIHYDNAQAEIEKLRNIVKTDLLNAKSDFKLSLSDISEIRAEAIKEFEDKFNSLFQIFDDYDTIHIYRIKDRLDILKEIVGDGDA